MAESSLVYSGDALKKLIGYKIGFGRGETRAWSTEQERAIDEVLVQGQHLFYHPPVLPGERTAHQWRFLRPITTIDISNTRSGIAEGISGDETPRYILELDITQVDLDNGRHLYEEMAGKYKIRVGVDLPDFTTESAYFDVVQIIDKSTLVVAGDILALINGADAGDLVRVEFHYAPSDFTLTYRASTDSTFFFVAGEEGGERDVLRPYHTSSNISKQYSIIFSTDTDTSNAGKVIRVHSGHSCELDVHPHDVDVVSGPTALAFGFRLLSVPAPTVIEEFFIFSLAFTFIPEDLGATITFTASGRTFTILEVSSRQQILVSGNRAGLQVGDAFTMPLTSSSFRLPQNLGGIIPPVTLVSGGLDYGGVTLVPDGEIRKLNQTSASRTGRPQLCAVVPVSAQLNDGQQYNLLVYPSPDGDYTLQFRYFHLANKLDENIVFAWGGSAHSETLKQACFASAELYLDDTRGFEWERYIERLSASVAFDRAATAPQNLGYMTGHRGTGGESDWPILRTQTGSIVLNQSS